MFEPPAAPGIPLELTSTLAGDAGFGKSAPLLMPTDVGVLVSRRGAVSLHTHDLRAEVWRLERAGWCALGVRAGDTVVTGAFGGHFHQLDIATGAILRQCPVGDETTALEAVCEDLLLVRPPGRRIGAVTWDGGVVWESDLAGKVVALEGEAFYVSTERHRRLRSCDATTGASRWSWQVPVIQGPTECQRILSWGSGVVPMGDNVLVRVWDGRVVRLSASDGSVGFEGRLPAAPACLVTRDGLLLKTPFATATYDHDLHLRELLDYRAEVEPLYGGQPPTVNAFCVTSKAVFWTTMQAVLMGVSRRAAERGRRAAWSVHIPGAIMPIAEPPIAWGPYLYLTKKGEDPELLCLRWTEPD
jgi:hypothetical protein